MTPLFLKILQLSITASFLIVAVVVLRVLLKKAPKGMRYVLWAMVGLRLLVPFTIESLFSVLPSKGELATSVAPATDAVVVTTATSNASEVTQSADLAEVLSYVWLCGALLMLLYMIVSVLRVRLMVRESVLYKDNVYLCDHVKSPFVLGVIKPKIYLNSSMNEKDSKLIIAHERTHIKHMDNVFKPLGFLILCVYWFNPLCWLSYFLFVKDIELFCDETVIKTLSEKGKKDYSYALLSCSASKNLVTACPLAFAENSVKTRIKNIIGYKKSAIYIMVISTVLCVATMLMFMTNPVSAEETEKTNAVSETTAETVAETVTPTIAEATAPTEAKTEAPTQKPTEPVAEQSYTDSGTNSGTNSDNQNEVTTENEDTVVTDPQPDIDTTEKADHSYAENTINPDTNPDNFDFSINQENANGLVQYDPYS